VCAWLRFRHAKFRGSPTAASIVSLLSSDGRRPSNEKPNPIVVTKKPVGFRFSPRELFHASCPVVGRIEKRNGSRKLPRSPTIYYDRKSSLPTKNRKSDTCASKVYGDCPPPTPDQREPKTNEKNKNRRVRTVVGRFLIRVAGRPRDWNRDSNETVETSVLDTEKSIFLSYNTAPRSYFPVQ